MRDHALLCRILAALLCCLAWPVPGLAFANVAVGDPIDPVELPTLDGGRAALLSRDALANVFVFFRPQQDHSLDTLKQLAACEKEFAGKRVHWVAIVSSSWPRDEVRKVIAASGIRMPVVVDEGDALYGKLGVRLHPVVGIADDRFRLVAYEPFHEINYCDRIRAKIRYALHEIDQAAVAKSENPDAAPLPSGKAMIAGRYVRMGELYLRMQQFDKAAGAAEKAIAEDAELAAAQVLLGDALAGQRRCDEAARAYAAAAKLDPGSAAAIDAKRAACAAR